jgi:hypothetical protein
LQEWEALEPEH